MSTELTILNHYELTGPAEDFREAEPGEQEAAFDRRAYLATLADTPVPLPAP